MLYLTKFNDGNTLIVIFSQVKASRLKEDYVKKLAELHQGHVEEESEDTVPELRSTGQPRMGRRSSKV